VSCKKEFGHSLYNSVPISINLIENYNLQDTMRIKGKEGIHTSYGHVLYEA